MKLILATNSSFPIFHHRDKNDFAFLVNKCTPIYSILIKHVEVINKMYDLKDNCRLFFFFNNQRQREKQNRQVINNKRENRLVTT